MSICSLFPQNKTLLLGNSSVGQLMSNNEGTLRRRRSNSGYTYREESECGRVACQKSKSVDRVLHRCGPVTEPWSPGEFYKSSPLRKFYVILTFRNGDKRGRCKYCNLAFMNCSLEILACQAKISSEQFSFCLFCEILSFFILTFASLVFYVSQMFVVGFFYPCLTHKKGIMICLPRTHKSVFLYCLY